MMRLKKSLVFSPVINRPCYPCHKAVFFRIKEDIPFPVSSWNRWFHFKYVLHFLLSATESMRKIVERIRRVSDKGKKNSAINEG